MEPCAPSEDVNLSPAKCFQTVERLVLAGMEAVAETEEGDASVGDVGAAAAEVSAGASSLRRGMAAVKLEDGEAAADSATGGDGDGEPHCNVYSCM